MIVHIPVGSTNDFFSAVRIVLVDFDDIGTVIENKVVGFAVIGNDGSFEPCATINDAVDMAKKLNNDNLINKPIRSYVIVYIPVGSTNDFFSVVRIFMVYFNDNGTVIENKIIGFAVIGEGNKFEYFKPSEMNDAITMAEELNSERRPHQ
jgi:uncharacterized protein (UPF0297 family)